MLWSALMLFLHDTVQLQLQGLPLSVALSKTEVYLDPPVYQIRSKPNEIG